MVSAAVGFQCPECVREGQRRTRQPSIGMRSPMVVTHSLIAINAVIWFITVAVTGDISLWGGQITSVHLDYALAGRFVADGEAYRLVTSGFLHYGLLHVGMNMFVLWWLGRLLEPGIGGARLLLIYAVSMVGGSLGALLLDPNALTAGASGAVFGVAGAVAVAERASPSRGQSTGVLGFLAINIVISLAIPGISLGGHVGGLVLGALAAGVLWGSRRWPLYVRLAAEAAPLRLLPELVVAGLGAGTVWLALNVVAPRWYDPIF